MSGYIYSIETAFFLFPFMAALFTMPYVVYHYHKYGAVMIFRSIIVYSFILYLINLYFLVILPLPSIEHVANLKTPFVQLIPFQFVVDFFKESGIQWNHPATYLGSFRHASFYNVIFNVMMFVPYGIYLKYYFNCSFRKTFLYSFFLSLFFELTQLSGLYGIYPRPYRLFDVDDLMINTLGGIIGYSITRFLFFLPSRQKLDELSYRKGDMVSFYRRMVAYIFDMIIILFLHLFIKHFPVIIILYYFLLPVFTKGRTLGKRIVQIKLVHENNQPMKWYQPLLRYGLLYCTLFGLPYLAFHVFAPFYASNNIVLLLGALSSAFLVIILYFYFFFECLRSSFFHKKLFLYERMSKTKNVSTIQKKIDKHILDE